MRINRAAAFFFVIDKLIIKEKRELVLVDNLHSVCGELALVMDVEP